MEVGGGAGGLQLRLTYHTHYGSMSNMADCGGSTDHFPFCLYFGNKYIDYTAHSRTTRLFLVLNEDCIDNVDARYYCKKSYTNLLSTDLTVDANAERVVLNPSYPVYVIVPTGGTATLANREYVVQDN